MFYTKAVIKSVCKAEALTVKLTPCAGWTFPGREESILFIPEKQDEVNSVDKIEIVSIQHTHDFRVPAHLENFLLIALDKKMEVGLYVCIYDQEGTKVTAVQKVELC